MKQTAELKSELLITKSFDIEFNIYDDLYQIQKICMKPDSNTKYPGMENLHYSAKRQAVYATDTSSIRVFYINLGHESFTFKKPLVKAKELFIHQYHREYKKSDYELELNVELHVLNDDDFPFPNIEKCGFFNDEDFKTSEKMLNGIVSKVYIKRFTELLKTFSQDDKVQIKIYNDKKPIMFYQVITTKDPIKNDEGNTTYSTHSKKIAMMMPIYEKVKEDN